MRLEQKLYDFEKIIQMRADVAGRDKEMARTFVVSNYDSGKQDAYNDILILFREHFGFNIEGNDV